jgi:hypothetical protein
LRQVNGDGGGDTAIALPFADVLLPAWSRDGGLFAISAPDPNRPNDRSYNVFAINPLTGAITPVTIFQDVRPDPETATFQFVIAQYKAFSPDRNAMAVSSTIVSGSRGQTTRTTPVLEVYTTASRAAAALVHVYTERTGITHHAGEGVDWSPNQNVLLTPVESSAPYLSDPSRSGQVTALFLLDPVDGAMQKGRFRQITFPRADQGSNTSDAFKWGEHDYQPKFSPNGVAVAYVRSFQNISLSRGGQDPNVQSLRILNLNTGADTEVLRMPQGTYVTSLDWSPDGTALVFDLGQQESGINGLQQNALPQTNEIYVVNANGTGVRRLRAAGAATPAWKPLPPGRATPAGNNVTVLSPSGDASVIFPAVTQGGTTTFAPINPAAAEAPLAGYTIFNADAPPAGYTVLNNAPAYDITTTAAFTPPAIVCHTVSAITNEAEFARVRILHGENGQLVDRTILTPDTPAPSFATRKVCARVNSLSVFVTALAPASTTTTPIDDPRFFVRQHYLDFLEREPDQSGWDYWSSQITQCGADQTCVNNRRIGVSNAFFFELEYQQTGAYVFRLYRAAFGNNQPFPNPDTSNTTEAKKYPSYAVFSKDRAKVVGGSGLAQSQLDLANQFVQRAEFLSKYPASLDGTQFVDAVLANIKNDVGVDLSSQRAALISLFNSGGRGAVIYRLADDNASTNPINNRSFIDAEYNRAFVATQYFGYLRRDADIGGLLFWLNQVNRFPLRSTGIQNAMVCSFITSAEYQLRFGTVVTHSNKECPQ